MREAVRAATAALRLCESCDGVRRSVMRTRHTSLHHCHPPSQTPPPPPTGQPPPSMPHTRALALVDTPPLHGEGSSPGPAHHSHPSASAHHTMPRPPPLHPRVLRLHRPPPPSQPPAQASPTLRGGLGAVEGLRGEARRRRLTPRLSGAPASWRRSRRGRWQQALGEGRRGGGRGAGGRGRGRGGRAGGLERTQRQQQGQAWPAGGVGGGAGSA